VARLIFLVLLLSLISLTIVACSGTQETTTSTPPIAAPVTPTEVATEDLAGELVVFAASSLIDAFNEMKTAFESEHPDVTIIYNFAGTPTLRTQLELGAQADVFASANEPQMEQAVQSGVIEGAPVVFASNQLVVIAPSDEESVRELSDLANDGVRLVLALEEVPVGAYARESIAKMAQSVQFGASFAEETLGNVVSEESNVRQVVAKVVLGEADAGIVYSTDVTGDDVGQVRVIPIPDEYNMLAMYPMAQVKNAENSIAAQAFIEFVRSPQGQAILARYGFGGIP
jgi:molybdate transport system substrate-binding protein